MELSDVYLITPRIKRVPARSLDALEKSLGFPLPTGYRDYLTRLGVGRFSGFLSVHPPAEVRENITFWRESRADVIIDGMDVGMYSKAVLSPQRVREAIPFAHTDNGDEFVCTPSRGGTLFVIPRGDSTIRTLRKGFAHPIACCRAVTIKDSRPYFEATNGRRKLTNFAVRGGVSVVDPALTERWGTSEIRRFRTTNDRHWGSVTVYGVRAIEGLIKVYSKPHGGHTVSLSYDKDYAREVREFSKALSMSKRRK